MHANHLCGIYDDAYCICSYPHCEPLYVSSCQLVHIRMYVHKLYIYSIHVHVFVQVYIASCEDLQIRVYCPNFTVLQGVPMPSSALCLLYLEGSDELLAGGVGQLHTWALHPQQKNMLTKTTSFTTTIKPQQVRTYARTLQYVHQHCLHEYVRLYIYVQVH